MTTDYDELIDQLPDNKAAIELADATLLFIGEAWINGHAREVDNSRAEFTVPLADLHRDHTAHIGSPGKQTEDHPWFIHSTPMNHYVSDAFRTHENAPEWVQEWQGPFEVKLKTWGV